ncbi:MAG: alpha/beta hydrolase [Acidimicrobiales bacterium]|nr:alpha/beta hydrolase [Acidimicrobiales bacterium]
MSAPIFATSADGTRLRLERAGQGEPVVLVHGTMGGKGDWHEVVRRLSDHHEVTAFDRRGRGGSGDGPDYCIEREIEDILAVIDASGPPVHLVGHSFGAILSLLVAARADGRVDKLVLYEPPLGAEEPAADEWLDELDAMVAAGDLDAAVRTFATAANITEHELQTMERNDRAWSGLRDGIGTAGREIRAARAVLPLDPAVVAAISARTLVLLGAEQDHPSYSGVSDLAAQLASGTLEHVPGHHVAQVFAPDAFVAKIRAFLDPTP